MADTDSIELRVRPPSEIQLPWPMAYESSLVSGLVMSGVDLELIEMPEAQSGRVITLACTAANLLMRAPNRFGRVKPRPHFEFKYELDFSVIGHNIAVISQGGIELFEYPVADAAQVTVDAYVTRHRLVAGAYFVRMNDEHPAADWYWGIKRDDSQLW